LYLLSVICISCDVLKEDGKNQYNPDKCTVLLHHNRFNAASDIIFVNETC